MKFPICSSLYYFFSAHHFYKKLCKLRHDDEALIVIVGKFGDLVYGMLYANQLKKETGKKIAVYCTEKQVKYVKNYDCVDRIITYPATEFYMRKIYTLCGLNSLINKRNKKQEVIITVPTPAFYKGKTVKEIYRDVYFDVKHDEIELFNLKEKPLVKSIENFENDKDKIVVINPYANSYVKNSQKTMQPVADMLIENGYKVYTNVVGDQKPLQGTLPLNCPVEELYSICENCKAFISVRSGIADLMCATKCFMFVVYLKNKNLRNVHSLKDFRKDNIEEYFVSNNKDVQKLVKVVKDCLVDFNKNI